MAGRYGNLVAHISKAMSSDDEDQSEMLANIYLLGSQAEKDVLDRAFICLCGWSIETLMNKCEKEGIQDTTTPDWWCKGEAVAVALSHFSRNRERDLRSVEGLREAGRRVAVVWECAIRTESVAVVDAVQGFLVGRQEYIETSEGKARGCLDIRSDILSETQVGA